MQVTCVITGFDAFGEHEKNPSELAVGRLPGVLNVDTQCEVRLVKGVLPTCCQDAWEVLRGLVEEAGGAQVLVLTGVAGKRNAIGLERFGLNIRDYRIPDNQGHQWKDAAIIEGGAEALKTNLPVRELAETLNRAGFVAEVSNHAGSYICNDVYYRALAEWQREGRGVLFVHLPEPSKYGPEQSENGKEAVNDEEAVLKIYAEALEVLVKEVCKAVVAV